jgi:hypothetical protein
LHDVAEHDVIDIAAGEAALFERGSAGRDRELGRADIFETAAKGAERGPLGCDNYDCIFRCRAHH